MPWLQLKARIAPEQADTLEELLMAEGASAISLQDAHDDPVFEPERGTTPLWHATVLTGLYDDLTDVDAMLERVHQAWAMEFPDAPCPEIDYELLDDRDWEREWMDGFAPLQMGTRLWVVPSWHKAPDPNAVNLLLDPGLAFGTGTHPTTAMCLNWLDGLAVEGALDGRTVLDFGCGSGILAIAALRLGATQAVGTDIDPQALTASRDNAERNAIAAEDFTLSLPEQLPETTFDVVLANILAGPLIELAALISGHVAPGGRLALSGVLVSQAQDVLDAYLALGMHMHEPIEHDGWVCLTGQRPAT